MNNAAQDVGSKRIRDAVIQQLGSILLSVALLLLGGLWLGTNRYVPAGSFEDRRYGVDDLWISTQRGVWVWDRWRGRPCQYAIVSHMAPRVQTRLQLL